jgi:hypothetical protein
MFKNMSFSGWKSRNKNHANDVVQILYIFTSDDSIYVGL